jgi:hypothetical protein
VNEFRLQYALVNECTSRKKTRRNAWKTFHSYLKTPLHHRNTMGPAAYQPLSHNKKHNNKEEDIVLLVAALSAAARVEIKKIIELR